MQVNSCALYLFFRDVKKKLRLALCSADSVAFPVLTHSTRNGLPDHTDPEGKSFLTLQCTQLAQQRLPPFTCPMHRNSCGPIFICFSKSSKDTLISF
jgi:hypothetical protein